MFFFFNFRVWKKKRSVLAVFVAFIGLCMFVLSGIHSVEDKSILSTASQVTSFLVSGSWNILWLFTVETFGNTTR